MGWAPLIASRLFGPAEIPPSFSNGVAGAAFTARANRLSIVLRHNWESSSCIYSFPTPNISAGFSILAGSCTISGILDGIGAAARFSSIRGLTAALDGTLYVVGSGYNSFLRRVTPQGVTSTMVAAGQLSFGTFSSAASSFALANPVSFALPTQGTLYSITSDGMQSGSLTIFYTDKPQQIFTTPGCADGSLATASFT